MTTTRQNQVRMQCVCLCVCARLYAFLTTCQCLECVCYYLRIILIIYLAKIKLIELISCFFGTIIATIYVCLVNLVLKGIT